MGCSLTVIASPPSFLQHLGGKPVQLSNPQLHDLCQESAKGQPGSI